MHPLGQGASGEGELMKSGMGTGRVSVGREVVISIISRVVVIDMREGV